MIPLRDNVPGQNTPWVTWLLIFLNLLVFGYQSSLPREELMALVYQYGLVPLDVSEGLSAGLSSQTLFLATPLLSSLFLHGSWFHLISNMWSLWLFGDNVYTPNPNLLE